MNNFKKPIALAIPVILLLTQVLSGCSGKNSPDDNSLTVNSGTVIADTDAEGNVISGGDAVLTAQSVEYTGKDTETSFDRSTAGIIEFGEEITSSSTGATVSENTVTILLGGEYIVKGVCDNGQLIVNLAEKNSVHLIFEGLTLTCSNSAPIYVKNATKVVLTLAEGSENILTDTADYVFDVVTDTETGAEVTSDEPDAVLYSKEDLSINGSGSLTVNANFKYGIACKDELKLLGGNITVNSVDNGIKGKDYVVIDGSNVTVTAVGDGIKSTNTDNTSLGFVTIRSGKVDITSGEDGIQAETALLISGGTIGITSGGGASSNSVSGSQSGFGGFGSSTTVSSAISKKGLKAGVGITISGGTINVNSYDDALHSNDAVAISNGTLTLASGDDGIHGDNLLTIAGGTIDITDSYEGLEAAVIRLDGGKVSVTASDDGVNAAGGSTSSTQGSPFGGMGGGMSSSSGELYITDGYYYINSKGDGLDSNTTIIMSGGTVIVCGPTDNGNGAIDYESSFTMTGGFLVATGSSGMAQQPGTSSTQYTAMVTLTASQSAGSIVSIRDADGNDIVTIAPEKAYNNIVVCSPAFAKGQTYTVYTGGSCTGTAVNGLYQDGAYTGGTAAGTFTITSITTALGSSGGMGGGFGGGGFGGGMGGRR